MEGNTSFEDNFNLCIHLHGSHVSRVGSYMLSKFPAQCEITKTIVNRGRATDLGGLAFFQIKNNSFQFIKDTMDDVHLLRVIHRFYPYTNEADSLAGFLTKDLFQNYKSNHHLPMDSPLVLRLQAYPSSLQKDIDDVLFQTLPGIVEMHPKVFTHYLSVVQCENKYYYGIVPKELFYVKVESKFTVDTPISRAYYKLREAVDRARIEIQPNWKVIDLGASPGGWTKFVAEKATQGSIVAIDPGELKIEPTNNVVHLNKKAEECVDYLRENGPFDMLVCDIGREQEFVVPILKQVIPFLKPGAPTIWTIKLQHRKEESLAMVSIMKEITEHVHKELGNDYARIEIVWLLANKYERTVLSWKNQ